MILRAQEQCAAPDHLINPCSMQQAQVWAVHYKRCRAYYTLGTESAGLANCKFLFRARKWLVFIGRHRRRTSPANTTRLDPGRGPISSHAGGELAIGAASELPISGPHRRSLKEFPLNVALVLDWWCGGGGGAPSRGGTESQMTEVEDGSSA